MSKPIPINTKTKLITNYSSESCSSERYDAYKDPYEEEYEEYGDYGTPPTDYKSKNSQSVSREMGVGITIAAVGILTLSPLPEISFLCGIIKLQKKRQVRAMTRIETRSFETVRWLLIAKSSHFLNSAVEGTFLSSINLYTLIQMEAPKKPIPKQSVLYPPGWEQIGVYMFKKYVDEQTTNLLESYRLMVSLHTKDKELSENYYNEIMKTGAKVAYLYKQGYISKEELSSLKIPFRKFCSILTNSFRYLSFDPITDEKIDRISEVISKFSAVVINMLSPFTNDKGLEKLELLLNYSKSKEFLLFCFDIPNMDSFKPIIFTLSYYLAEFQ